MHRAVRAGALTRKGGVIDIIEPSSQASREEAAVVRKVMWRLLPFLCLLYFVAYLDRVNVGFAALTMNQDLGLSATAFGLGAGIFFLGYFLFEVPSNFMLRRFGARVWIARIMLTWGVISIGMAFVTGTRSFLVLRFLLGVAEAGFFPGMIYYFTHWFPNRVRGGILGLFIIATPASTIIGAPLSTTLLGTSVFGLAGWQSMFIIEGVPAILLGFVTLLVLRDSPAKAAWLTDRERQTLERAIHRDELSGVQTSLRAGLASITVWRFALLYAALMVGVYGFGFWAPQIAKALGGLSNQQVGFVLIIPYACATLAMCLWARHSDRTGERTWHLALPAFLAAAGFLYGSFTDDVYLSIAAFTVGAIGIYATLPVFWTLPTSLLGGTAAAGGIALINSIGNLSGYFGPVIIGRLKDSTHGYAAGLLVIAASMAFAGILGFYSGAGRAVHGGALKVGRHS
jgi:ACS family tartrate transporter-like MFS transporter